MKKNTELCIRDKNGYIVGWKAGYSDDELKQLLERHKDEGWHISYAENTDGGEFIEDGAGDWEYDYTEDENGNVID